MSLDEERRTLDALGAARLTRADAGFPASLKDLPHAPDALYLQGRWDDRPAVAVVGSRWPTPYGRRMARRLAGELARRGVAIVSGLARGVDAEAHAAALDAGGTTWAVLGCGLGRVYPPENRVLASRIVERGGCLLSEYPLDAPPHRAFFPQRNRLIAGLALAVVVVEGRLRSGAVGTAKWAGEYGRELLAVPGPADSPLSETPHRLLREGARLAARAEDVLAVLPPGAALPAAPPPAGVPLARLQVEEARVLAVLGGEALSLDQLGLALGLDIMRLSTIMFGLEIKRLVRCEPGQRYAKETGPEGREGFEARQNRP